MGRRCLGTVGYLAIVLIAYSVYALAAAPVIEPEYTSPTTTSEDSEFYWQTAPSQSRQMLSQIFREDAWQLDSPKVFEFSQGEGNTPGILLFQEYEQLDGEFLIKPCTCVIFQSNNKKSRIVTMHAPSGAVLNVDALASEPTTDNQEALTGRLIGDVIIHSQESEPGANDGIQFITRNVQFEKNRIWTTHDVEFQYAGHLGRGRDLIITLGEQEKNSLDSTNSRPFSRVDSIELIHVDELVLQMERELLPDADPLVVTDRNSVPAQSNSEMVIQCNGPFRIDQANSQLSLEDQVQVTFKRDGQVDDTMVCDKLQVTFTPPYTNQSDTTNPLLDTSGQFNPQSIIADGNPVLIQSPSRQLAIKGQRVSIDLDELKFSIKDAVESTITFENFSIKVPKLEYTFADDFSRLGTYKAEGPGELRLAASPNEPAQSELFVQWQANSTLTVNDQQEKVLALNKDARIQISETESISSDRLHVWLEEIEVPSADSKEAEFELTPYKMVATGHVEIDLPELHAKAHQTRTWISREPATTGSQPSTKPALDNPIKLFDRSQNSGNPETLKRYIVTGELLNLDLYRSQSGLQIKGANMEGNLSFHQQPLPGQSRSALALHGERINLKRGLSGLAEITITGKERQGKPAWISYEGFELSGNSIRLDQQSNLVWIDGAGELVHLAQDKPNPENAKRITWEEQMAFTGSKFQLFGNVQSRFRMQSPQGETKEISLRCKVLDLYLNQRIDFQQPHLSSPIQIRECRALDQVEIHRRTIDKNNQHRDLQHIRVEHLRYFPSDNRIVSDKQGSIRYTWVDDGSLPTIGKPLRDQGNIQSLNVEFNKGVRGDLANLELSFHGKVQALLGSVPQWDSLLTPQEVKQNEGVELNCDELSIANVSNTDDLSIVISAIGNTHIAMAGYTAVANRVSYSQFKNNIVLEGGRGDAQLWLNTNKTLKPNASARRIFYDLKTGSIDIQSPSLLDSGN